MERCIEESWRASSSAIIGDLFRRSGMVLLFKIIIIINGTRIDSRVCLYIKKPIVEGKNGGPPAIK